MELTMLLIGASVAAGAHMILFAGAATLAWVYFKRCRKLQAQLAQDDIVSDDRDNSDDRDSRNAHNNRDIRDEEYRRGTRELRDWNPTRLNDRRRNRYADRFRGSTSRRARRERRHERDWPLRNPDDSSTYVEDDETPREERPERNGVGRATRGQDGRDLEESR